MLMDLRQLDRTSLEYTRWLQSLAKIFDRSGYEVRLSWPSLLSVISEILHLVSPVVSSQTSWRLGAARGQGRSCQSLKVMHPLYFFTQKNDKPSEIQQEGKLTLPFKGKRVKESAALYICKGWGGAYWGAVSEIVSGVYADHLNM